MTPDTEERMLEALGKRPHRESETKRGGQEPWGFDKTDLDARLSSLAEAE